MAKKNYYKKSKTSSKSKKQYSAAEKKSYKRGFFAGLIASNKKKASGRSQSAKKRTLADIPNNYQHNVLFNDERYLNIYRHFSRELGFEHEKARDYALHMYKTEFGDKVLRDHYEL